MKLRYALSVVRHLQAVVTYLIAPRLACRFILGREFAREVARLLPSIKDAQLIVVSMIRDDLDVVPTWLDHVCTFADAVIVVDHNSSEDLQSLVCRHKNAHYARLTRIQYLQEQVFNFVLKDLALVVNRRAILMPLDSDEFPMLSYISSVLNARNDVDVYSATWMNGVLAHKSDTHAGVRLGDKVKIALIDTAVGKVAFRAGKFLTPVYLRFGNHEMMDVLGRKVRPAIRVDFGILHLPIRSEQQLERKLSNGIRACENAGWLSTVLGINFHWREADAVIKNGLTQPLSTFLTQFVANYGLPMMRWQTSRFTAELAIDECLASDAGRLMANGEECA